MDEDVSVSNRLTDDRILGCRHWPSERTGYTCSSGELSKVDEIVAACKEPRDVATIAGLATSEGGLMNDNLRRVACMSDSEPVK